MISKAYQGYTFEPHAFSITRASDSKVFDWKNQVWSTPPAAFNDPTLPNFFLTLTPTQVFGSGSSPTLLRVNVTLPAPTGGSVTALFPDGRYGCAIHLFALPANFNPIEAWEVQLWSGSDQAPGLPATASIAGTVTFGH